MRSLLLGLCYFLAIHSALASPASPIEIAGVAIILPVPAGFANALGISATIDQKLEGFNNPKLRTLVFLVPEANLNPFDQNALSLNRRFFMAQSILTMESRSLTVSDFSPMRASVKKANEDFARKHQALGLDPEQFRTNPDGFIALGVFHDEASAVGVAAIGQVSSVIMGKTSVTSTVIAHMTTLVKGKLIDLSVTSAYRSQADAEWVRSAARQWLKSVAQAN